MNILTQIWMFVTSLPLPLPGYIVNPVAGLSQLNVLLSHVVGPILLVAAAVIFTRPKDAHDKKHLVIGTIYLFCGICIAIYGVQVFLWISIFVLMLLLLIIVLGIATRFS